MGAQGTATLDFGAFPGADTATVAVTTGTGIVAGSLVEAWTVLADSVDHSADEHLVEQLDVSAGAIVAGAGFTVYGVCTGVGDVMVYGKWNVGWVWS